MEVSLIAPDAPLRPARTMAKAQPAPPKASTSNLAAAAPNKRALSELDDIFAKRPKVTPTTVVAPAVEHKAAKGKGKGKAKVDEAAASVKKAPVEIVDTSASIIAYRPEAAPTKRKAGGEGGGDGAGVGKEEEEEDRFMDSRGTNRKLFFFPTIWVPC
jgi:hypothetical protein